MFCKHCGSQIADDSTFCQNCGKATDLFSSNNQSNQNYQSSSAFHSNKNFNREIMLQYLYDLRTLESSSNKLSWDIYNLENTIPSLGQSGYYEIRPVRRENWGFFAFAAGVVIVAWAINWFINIPFFDADTNIVLIIGIIIALILAGFGLQGVIEDNRTDKNNRIKTNQYIQADKERVQRELRQKEILLQQYQGTQNELSEINSMLEKAYSINIIPSQFRNIWAVYYLYDFLSTSNQSLEEALLHCDLNEIKQQLNIIIEQNRQILINQAIQIAQNDDLVAQNNHMINRLAQVEKNTALAAQYAEVAAINAECNAKIAAAQYLFK